MCEVYGHIFYSTQMIEITFYEQLQLRNFFIS